MRILHVTPELAPVAKVGGLADVVGALPRLLAERGHELRVVLPLYADLQRSPGELRPVEVAHQVPVTLGTRELRFNLLEGRLPGSDLRVHWVQCAPLYERPGIYTHDVDEHQRWILLSRAALLACQRTGWAPDIVHVHDWATGLVPLYLRSQVAWDRLFADTRSVLTIHNLAHQGSFGAEILPELDIPGNEHLLHQEELWGGRVNLLQTGLLHADRLTTVSPSYAREIQGPEQGAGLDGLLRRRSADLVGILNGIDAGEWDPRTDPHLPFRYSERSLWRKQRDTRALLGELGLPADPPAPVVGMVTRLAWQKGLDLLHDAVAPLLQSGSLRLVVLGSGEARYESLLHHLQLRFPDRVCFWRGFNAELAHRIEAGSDIFLMPSLYEPCGLNQMYSLRYGTVPVVHRTGGLADTVEPYDPSRGSGTGFVFEHATVDGVRWGLQAALELFAQPRRWRELMRRGMATDFSWERRAAEYETLYRGLAAARSGAA